METCYYCFDLDQRIVAVAMLTPPMADALNRDSEETGAGVIWTPSPVIGRA